MLCPPRSTLFPYTTLFRSRSRPLDYEPLDGLGDSRRYRGLQVVDADLLEPLVPDTGERLDLASDDRRREAHRLDLRDRGLRPEEREDREDQPAARMEMARGARDHPIEQLPAVGAAVVGERGRVAPRASRRRGHLRRVRADQIEALAVDGGIAVAEPRVDGDAVERRVDAHHLDGLGEDVRRGHPGAVFRGEHGGQAEATADLEQSFSRPRIEMLAEEERARLGRLDLVRDAKQAAAPGEQEGAGVATFQERAGSKVGALPSAGPGLRPRSWRPRAGRCRSGAARPRA